MEATTIHDESNNPKKIMSDILSRLPVKSLLKFRCVCKSWLSLISSSQFIKTHLNFSSNSNNKTYSLLLASFTFPIKFFACSISSILTNNASINPINLDFPFKEPIFKLVGTCNGLLCVSSINGSLILCNLATKKFKRSAVKKDNGVRNVSYGFSFDMLNDDYKVVELYQTKAMVYSLRDNNWREIEAFRGGCVSDNTGICVSEILHWYAFYRCSDTRFILSLDIRTYVYGIVELPEYDETEDDDVDGTLGEFGGCLGVKESWIKLVSIPYPLNPNSFFSPFFVSENGEVILNYDPHVMLYNSRNRSLRNLEIRGSTGHLLLVAALPYVESLVPLGLDG